MKHSWSKVRVADVPSDPPYHNCTWFTRARRCRNCGKYQVLQPERRDDVTGKLIYRWTPTAGRCKGIE